MTAAAGEATQEQVVGRARRRPVEEQPPGPGRPDYADAFEITVRASDPRSAEQFARDALERAPLPVRWTVLAAHRYVLRLRLGPRPSPDHVMGWKIVTSEPNLLRLEASSPLLGRGVIVGRRTEPTRSVITTFVYYAPRPPSRLIWAVVGPLHRAVAPYLLKHAVAVGERRHE